MPNLHELENAMPVAPLKIIALPSAEKMGRRINDYMVCLLYTSPSPRDS